ncbi:TolC family protein [Xylophilus ampelinus]|uniref:TolC family protein n=1 Tax=Xylophilus ampelinus TaxID=54067 RepID=UPI001F409DE9|nr:TolC family protein [Xylophilus ampelinus]MCS4510492.1 TolC family protein [Xylophilus ampelinus]
MPRPSSPRPSLHRPASLLALCAGLAGCAAPALPSLHAPLPAAFTPLAAAVLPPGAPVPDPQSWWKTLADPQLDALVAEALRQNLTLAQARSRWTQARLLQRRDDRQYLPVASAGTRPVQDVTASDSYLHASLDLSWELGLFGAHESVGRIAQARLDAAAGAEQAARVALVADVVRRYVELRAAQRQVALLDALQALDGRSIEMAAVRQRYRLGTADEAAQARLRQLQAEAQRTQPALAAAQAVRALAVLVGRTEPDPAWSAPAAPPALGAFGFGGVPADLLRARPDIRAAEAAVLKAAGEQGLAQSDLYPHLALGASLLYSYNLTQYRRNTADNVPGIGPAIDIPLFDWGRRRALADARQEALQEALLAYRQAVLEGVADTESALAALDQQALREARLREARTVQEQRAGQRATLRRLGLASDYEQLADQRTALQADLDVADAQAAHVLAFVGLYKALGGAPMPAPEAAAAGAPSATLAQVRP